MKVQGQPPHHSFSRSRFVPPSYSRDEAELDDTISELRDLWPSAVDVAKQPGTLYRLHAFLNS